MKANYMQGIFQYQNNLFLGRQIQIVCVLTTQINRILEQYNLKDHSCNGHNANSNLHLTRTFLQAIPDANESSGRQQVSKTL